jgi:DNA/RNA-binding domain of Phe-tRNA-synthetase-like protein
VIFADASEMVIARRWCWRQSAESASQLDTGNVLIVVEAHHAESQADVANALADLQKLVGESVGGRVVAASLNAQCKVFVEPLV